MGNVYYQRNKLANVLGISKETLRYYEEKQIIEPKRDPRNGYRVYDGMDCQTLIYLRMLRAYGFSLEDATSSAISYGDHSFEAMLRQRIAQTEQEIRRLTWESQILAEMAQSSQLWRDDPHQMRIEDCQDQIFFLEQLIGWEPVVDEQRNSAVKTLTAALPITFYGMIVDRAFFFSDGVQRPELAERSGILWRESDLNVLPEEVGTISCDRRYRWEKVLRFVEKLNKYEPEDMSDVAQTLMSANHYIHENGFQVSSDAVLRILPVSLPTEDSFLEIIIPIKKNTGGRTE